MYHGHVLPSGLKLHVWCDSYLLQGMLLNTAEVVPFRMTRNVVDGFGAAGTGGSLTQCAEITLGVLRQNSEAFMQASYCNLNLQWRRR